MVDQVLENKIYNIRPGDTLLRIAQVAGVSYDDILKLNPQIDNPNLIMASNTVVLPSAVSRQALLVETAKAVFPDNTPLWFKIAQRELGVSERPGNNPRILEYLATTTLPGSYKKTDQTSWCAAFVNWCFKTADIDGNNSAWALNWGTWGRETEPELGTVVVFHRDTATEKGGHVGFFVEDLGSKVKILGGNQGDAVSVSTYPKDGMKGPFHYKLASYRRPA
ncbi:TIGR02594 family protein [Agrobacterium fabrum]|uniref:TIGR02594 family protein n=1 Tax=Agrobacterium fabrum TaxID=1176649 RepID=UPI003BA2AE0E